MTLDEAKKLALNPTAFSKYDVFIVLEVGGKPIEGAASEGRASWAVDALTAHERRCGRDTQYVYVRAE